MDTKESTNIKDISLLLSTGLDLSKADSDLFLKELLDIISDRLIKEGRVEIENLGVFNINNVTLANEDEVEELAVGDIISYYCAEFEPDSSLKNLVNKPFINFETTMLNKDVAFDGVRVLEFDSEKGNVLIEESLLYTLVKEKEEEPIEEIVNEDAIVEDNYLLEETGDQTVEEVVEEEIIDAHILISDPPADVSIGTSKRSIRNSKRRHSKSKSLIMIATIGVVVMLTASAFFLRTKTISNKPEILDTRNEIVNNVVKEQSNSIIIDTLLDINNNSNLEDSLVDEPKLEIQIQSQPVVRKHEIITLPMGKTLRQIALEKYGHKEFWVYIYLKNKHKIENPNNVPVGVKLTLPFKDEYGIDASDSRSIRKASEAGAREMNRLN